MPARPSPVSVLLTLSGLVLLAALLVSAQRSGAQPLLPAADAPVLIRSLPATITASGRYVLALSLTARENPPPSAQHGIVVQADDVEMDLGGWALVGNRGTGTGILVVPPDKRERLRGLVIRNGTVRNWGAYGIEAGAVDALRLEDLHVAHNGLRGEPQAGARLGTGALVEGCHFHRNSGHGLMAGRGAVITRCIASGNGADGFRLDDLAVLRDSTAFDNGTDGMASAGPGSLLAGVASGFNAGAGVRTAGGAHVRGSTLVHNGSDGVSSGGSGLMAESLARGNAGAGFASVGHQDAALGNVLTDNGMGLFLLGATASPSRTCWRATACPGRCPRATRGPCWPATAPRTCPSRPPAPPPPRTRTVSGPWPTPAPTS